MCGASVLGYIATQLERVLPTVFGLAELGQMCVTVGFCVEAMYTPPPRSTYVRETSERAYTSGLHFLRETHLLMC